MAPGRSEVALDFKLNTHVSQLNFAGEYLFLTCEDINPREKNQNGTQENPEKNQQKEEREIASKGDHGPPFLASSDHLVFSTDSGFRFHTRRRPRLKTGGTSEQAMSDDE